jgi:hypothetical protein
MECELLGDVSIAAVFLVLLTLFLCLIFSCCIWGEGSYELSFDGNVVASGGEFGFDETKTFTTPTATADCYDVLIELFFDTYPQDTSWDISQGDNIVASSPPYADNLAEDTETLCLSPGNYVVTFYDVYQDGMCCQWGEGSYRVTSNQKVIKEGGEFGVSESTEFSLPTTAKRRDE